VAHQCIGPECLFGIVPVRDHRRRALGMIAGEIAGKFCAPVQGACLPEGFFLRPRRRR